MLSIVRDPMGLVAYLLLAVLCFLTTKAMTTLAAIIVATRIAARTAMTHVLGNRDLLMEGNCGKFFIEAGDIELGFAQSGRVCSLLP